MGFKPDATSAQLDHGEVWRKSDFERAEGGGASRALQALQVLLGRAGSYPRFAKCNGPAWVHHDNPLH